MYLLFHPAIPALFVIAYVCAASAGGRKYPLPRHTGSADEAHSSPRVAHDAPADRR